MIDVRILVFRPEKSTAGRPERRSGLTTPTRAGRLADASVDPTDARCANVTGIALLGEGLAVAESTNEHYWELELYSLSRELLLLGTEVDRSTRDDAERRSRRALSKEPCVS